MINFQNLPRSFFIAVVFFILYDIPVMYWRIHEYNIIKNLLSETIIILTATIILFCLIFSITYLAKILIIVLFAIGGASNYYLLVFHKIIDSGVLIDILSIDIDLIQEFLNCYLILSIMISILIGWVLFKIPQNKTISKFPKIIISILSLLMIIFFVKEDISKIPSYSLKLINQYLPFNIYNNIHSLTKYYIPHFNSMRKKNDLTKNHFFKFNQDKKEPITIIMIIGESMRGDLLSLNGYKVQNMPLIGKRKNIISFPFATSSATSTRISIPYMLTSAIPPNFDQAMSELSIISIFKHLGFQTSWIGSQGAFGIHETTYASIMMETDYHVAKHELNKIPGITNIYDEHLIPFLDKRLNEVDNNHFIIIHLMGSHWNFSKRYPKNFTTLFTPTCNSDSPHQCSDEELLNSYNNTILYSDNVLDQIISRVEKKNALLLYASDHGYSLNENSIFGNAYQGNNIPKEQIHIGMFIFTSEKFIKNYPHNYQQIVKRKMLPISHDYIFHSLLGCLDIESDIINNELNVCPLNNK
jgi:glucan phosphoethanolaminetransferase (alkaline phosphatase superfamily)